MRTDFDHWAWHGTTPLGPSSSSSSSSSSPSSSSWASLVASLLWPHIQPISLTVLFQCFQIKDFRLLRSVQQLVRVQRVRRHSDSFRHARLCRCSYFTSSLEPTETLTWKFNVWVWMRCVEPPSPCRLFITTSFSLFVARLLCSPVTTEVLEQDLLSHSGPDGPTACILILRSEETDACGGRRLMSRPGKMSESSHWCVRHCLILMKVRGVRLKGALWKKT